MEKLYKSKTFLKMAGGRMHTPHPTHLDLPLNINKLQKPSKKPGIFTLLIRPTCIIFFTTQSPSHLKNDASPSTRKTLRVLKIGIESL